MTPDANNDPGAVNPVTITDTTDIVTDVKIHVVIAQTDRGPATQHQQGVRPDTLWAGIVNPIEEDMGFGATRRSLKCAW